MYPLYAHMMAIERLIIIEKYETQYIYDRLGNQKKPIALFNIRKKVEK